MNRGLRLCFCPTHFILQLHIFSLLCSARFLNTWETSLLSNTISLWTRYCRFLEELFLAFYMDDPMIWNLKLHLKNSNLLEPKTGLDGSSTEYLHCHKASRQRYLVRLLALARVTVSWFIDLIGLSYPMTDCDSQFIEMPAEYFWKCPFPNNFQGMTIIQLSNDNYPIWLLRWFFVTNHLVHQVTNKGGLARSITVPGEYLLILCLVPFAYLCVCVSETC